MIARTVLHVMILLDLMLLISLSSIYISDDATAPGDIPTDDMQSGYEIIEETDTYKIYHKYGHTFMDRYEDGTVKTRVISQSELHMTIVSDINK